MRQLRSHGQQRTLTVIQKDPIWVAAEKLRNRLLDFSDRLVGV
jgi:hypothetical protein